jgi:HEAT repeat protein
MVILIVYLQNNTELTWVNWRWCCRKYRHAILNDKNFQDWIFDKKNKENYYAPLEVLLKSRSVLKQTKNIESLKSLNLIELLKETIKNPKENCRILILGDPGSGKTTALKIFTIELARINFWTIKNQAIPIFIELGKVQHGKLFDYLDQSIERWSDKDCKSIFNNNYDELLKRGYLILIFDALDETLGDNRAAITSVLELLLGKYENVPIIISMRSREEIEYSQLLESFQIYEIQELSDNSVDIFISLKLGKFEKSKLFKENLERYGLLQTGGIGRNPFWLKIILIFNIFERTRSKILEELTNKVLRRELIDKGQKNRSSWKIELPTKIQCKETKYALAWLAFQMSINNLFILKEENENSTLDGKRIISDWLINRNIGSKLLYQYILGIGRDSQILNYNLENIVFSHRLLQEYLSSWMLSERNDLLTPTLFKDMILNKSWWSTLFLYGDIIEDTNNIINRIIESGTSAEKLFLSLSLVNINSIQNQEDNLILKKILNIIKEQECAEELIPIILEFESIIGYNFLKLAKYLISEEDLYFQIWIIKILKDFKNPESLNILIKKLEEKNLDQDVIYEIKTALVSKEKLSIGPMISLLKNNDEFLQDVASEVLFKIGDPAVKPLINLLHEKNYTIPIISKYYYKIKHLIDSNRTGYSITGNEYKWVQLQEKNYEMQELSSKILSNIKNTISLGPTIKIIKNKNNWVQPGDFIEYFGDHVYIDVPIVYQEWDKSSLYRYKFRVLKPPIPRFKKQPKDHVFRLSFFWENGQRASEIISNYGESAGLLLLEILSNNKSPRWLSYLAIDSIGRIKYNKSVEILIKFLEAHNDSIRHCAAYSLANIGEPAVEPLIKILKDEEPYTFSWKDILPPGDRDMAEDLTNLKIVKRMYSAYILGSLNSKIAIDALIQTFEKDNTYCCLQYQILYVLGFSNYPRVLETLNKIYSQNKKGTTQKETDFAYYAKHSIDRIIKNQETHLGKKFPLNDWNNDKYTVFLDKTFAFEDDSYNRII